MMNKEDIKFLKDLQQEMLTQDCVCQANPRFWVVMQTVRQYGVDSDYGIDGSIITSIEDGDLGIDADDMKEIYDWLIENFEVDCKFEDGFIYINNEDEDILSDSDDIINYLESEGYDRYSIVNYRDNEEIVQDTMFLTYRECNEHIERNSYHYNKPHPYSMTAYRSPQVERLYKILQETNWDELEDKVKCMMI